MRATPRATTCKRRRKLASSLGFCGILVCVIKMNAPEGTTTGARIRIPGKSAGPTPNANSLEGQSLTSLNLRRIRFGDG